ncbi:MAG TPA: hypothetical protein VLB67_02625, partial [Acidimicrobiia bacterium]|nr:hypothetical protein [Acidimicrobiia bacterium]
EPSVAEEREQVAEPRWALPVLDPLDRLEIEAVPARARDTSYRRVLVQYLFRIAPGVRGSRRTL